MKEKKRVFELLPIILALGFIPLLVHMHTYDCKLSQFDWFPNGQEYQSDFFLYFKMVAIIIVGIVMVVMLLYKYSTDKRNFKWNNVWYSLIAYAFLALLSALFSQYRYFAFHGSYEVFETIWVVLCYVVFCFYSYQMIQSESDLKFVGKFAGIGIAIVTLIGLFQFFGLDFFRTGIGKRLISNVSYWPQVDELSFTFPLKTSYTTLYNTNYLAFYFGLFIPIAIILLLFAKNWKLRLFYGICTVILMLTLIGSNSKSALLTLGITFILGCVIFSKRLKKYWWIPLVGVAFLAIMVCWYAVRMGGFENLYNAVFVGTDKSIYDYAITDIETNEDNVVFHVNDTKLLVSYNMDNEQKSFTMTATYEDGTSVPFEQDAESGIMYLKDEKFPDCKIMPIMIGEDIAIQITMDGKDWHFLKKDEGGYYFYNAFGKYVKMEHIEKSDLIADNFFSGRGELWNYIIPRLKGSLILGSGANTFAMVYPQNNYIIKKYRGSDTLFDVKAHNMYLQQWLENGLLALLALLIFYGWYFIQSFRIYRKVEDFDLVSEAGLGIYLGTFTYMIVGFANDSNVCTAPVFWILFGIGFACNEIVKKSQTAKNKQERD